MDHLSYIILAIVAWLIVSLITPKKVRPFISLITAIVVAIFLFYILKGPPKEPTVLIPAHNGQEAYEISLKEFEALKESPDASALYSVENLDAFKKINKQIILHSDLSPELLHSLKDHPQFQTFIQGKTGVYVKSYGAHIQGQKVIPSIEGLEFISLPYHDVNQKLKRKQLILDNIRSILSPEQKPLN